MTNARWALPWIVAVAASCGSDPTGPIEDLPRELSVAERRLVEADNGFAWRIFRQIASQDPQSNLFVSPLSIAMALGMTHNGAAGETRAEMARALGLDGMAIEDVNQAFRDLIDLLLDLDPQTEFHLANSIWARIGTQIEPAFLDLNQRFFGAEVSIMDFSDPSSAPTINGWVSDQTQGKIESIVDDPISGSVVMFLINALYFKGTWTHQFDKDLTADRPFTLADGTVRSVPTMSHDEAATIRTASSPLGTAVDLPYGGGAFSMTILLPQDGVGTDGLLADIDEVVWADWMVNLAETDAIVQLPKFSLEYEIELSDVLKALGMVRAFGGGADFSNLSPGVWIDQVNHKTFVDVNEEGTEAAAVTSVVLVECACGPPVIAIDRPFLFVIRERFSGTVLFVGKMANPE